MSELRRSLISVVWNREEAAAVRTRNITTTHRGKFWKLLLPQQQSYYFQVCFRLSTEIFSYRLSSVQCPMSNVQAFLDDCEVSGKKFSSPRLRLTVSQTRPLVTRLLFLAHVGFCGKNKIPPQYEVNFSFSRKL